MAELEKFAIGETVQLRGTFTTAAGAATDPTVSITVTLLGPHGTTILTASSATKESTGIYRYDWKDAAALTGHYRWRMTGTDGVNSDVSMGFGEFEIVNWYEMVD